MKVIVVQPSNLLNKKELVADAHEHYFHAASPRSAETRSKVAHCVVVELALVVEQEKPPCVFAEAESFVCFANVFCQADFSDERGSASDW